MTTLFRKLGDLWSLFVGLGITGRQFCLPTLTVHYPRAVVPPEVTASYRGPIELVGLDKAPERPRCIACMLCVQACPSGCITITRAAAPKPTPQEQAAFAEAEARGEKPKRPAPPKAPGTWVYDFTLCSLCGSCVEVCPVDSLRFSDDIYLAGTTREEFRIDQLARLARKSAGATPEPAPEQTPPPDVTREETSTRGATAHGAAPSSEA